MKHLLVGAASAALLIPAATQAEINTHGSVYLGYGNVGAGGEEGAIGVLNLNFDGKHQLNDSVALTFKGDLYTQSNKDDLAYMFDDTYDVELGLDFGDWGKFSYSTYARCDAQRPGWVDGDLGNGGSIAVHPRIAPKYRCVGGSVPIFNAGPLVVDANDYFSYTLHRGPFGMEIYYDPNLNYDDWSGDDARTVVNMTVPGDGDLPPEAEINLSYAFPKVIVFAGANDLGDWFARSIVPVPSAGLAIIYEHQYQDAHENQHSDVLVLDWKPENMGLLKGVQTIYVRDETDSNMVVSTNFGTDQWTFGLAGDLDGDFAMEGSYQLTDNLEFLVGADTGFDDGDGFDFAGFPPPSADSRGGSFELGLRMNF